MMQLLFLINIIDKESTDSKLDFTKLHLTQTDNCHKYKATKHMQRENHIQWLVFQHVIIMWFTTIFTTRSIKPYPVLSIWHASRISPRKRKRVKNCSIFSCLLLYSSKMIEEWEGDVAQMVERSLSMREVRGSIPRISILFYFSCFYLISS